MNELPKILSENVANRIICNTHLQSSVIWVEYVHRSGASGPPENLTTSGVRFTTN